MINIYKLRSTVYDPSIFNGDVNVQKQLSGQSRQPLSFYKPQTRDYYPHTWYAYTPPPGSTTGDV